MSTAADFNKKAKMMMLGFLIFGGGGIALTIYTVVKRSKQQVQTQYMDSWLGGKDASPLSEYTVPIVADRVEESVKAGLDKLMNERDYDAAAFDVFANLALLDRLGRDYADFLVSEGKTVKVWEGEVRKIIDDSVMVEMQRILSSMATGEELHSRRIDLLIQKFYKFGDYNQHFEASKPALSRARAKLAGKWLRVPVAYNEGFETLRATLEQKFDPSTGFKLVFADAYGPEEMKATWRTFNVVCQPLAAINDNTPSDHIFPGPPAHIVGYFIYLDMAGNPRVRTSWDSLRDSKNVRGYNSIDEYARDEIPPFTIQ